MSRFQWLFVVLILGLGLLAGVLLLRVESLTPVQQEEASEEKTETPDGPHQGVVLGKDHPVQLEVVTQHQGRSQLQLRFYAIQGKEALLPAKAQLQVTLKRLGKTWPLALKSDDKGWSTQTALDEPHSFSLDAKLITPTGPQAYSWDHPENRLELSETQQRASHIGFELVAPRTLSETLELPGKIAVNQDRYAHITPRLSGIITQVYKHLGEPVSKGQLLAVIESRELGDLRLDYLQASQAYSQARKRYELEQGFFNSTAQLIWALKANADITVRHQELLRQVIGADRQTLLSAYSAYQLARETFAREQRLLPQQATSQAEYQQAQEALLSARATYQGAVEEVGRQRRLQLLAREQEMQAQAPGVEIAKRKLQTLGLGAEGASVRYELRAPINGTLLSSHIVVGEALAADADAFLIADLSEVWAEMMIPEAELETVRLNQHVEVLSQTGKYQSSGVVTHLGATVDETSRTAEAHAAVLNPQRVWKPGMFVTIRLDSNPFTVPVAVKQTAIQNMEGQAVVFVQDGEALQAVPVELGRKGSGWVEIRKGLRPGQRYVASNSFLIKAELEKALAAEE